MRISDWSSDVCSSDLASPPGDCPADASGDYPASHRGDRCGRRSPCVPAPYWTCAQSSATQRGHRLSCCPHHPRRHISPARHNRIVANFQGRNIGSDARPDRSEEHTSELQSLMRIPYAVFCLKKKKEQRYITITHVH